MQVVEQGHSVLLFYSSRKGCESTARHVSKFLVKFSARSGEQNGSDVSDIGTAIDALKRCPAGLDPVLEETLPCGVAYHHAGLTVKVFSFVSIYASFYLIMYERVACIFGRRGT